MRRQTSPEEEALEELRRLKGGAPSGKKKRTPWVRYMAVVLLAVVCIGGAELTACRFFAPALYEDLMEPVRETAIGQCRRRAGPWKPSAGRGTPPQRRRGRPPPP